MYKRLYWIFIFLIISSLNKFEGFVNMYFGFWFLINNDMFKYFFFNEVYKVRNCDFGNI